jgi:prevent-host-death family protein
MSVSVSELRANLQKYINQVEKGQPLEISVRGRVVAQMVPIADKRREAKKWLAEARKHSWLGDIESPLGIKWEVMEGDDS